MSNFICGFCKHSKVIYGMPILTVWSDDWRLTSAGFFVPRIFTPSVIQWQTNRLDRITSALAEAISIPPCLKYDAALPCEVWVVNHWLCIFLNTKQSTPVPTMMCRKWGIYRKLHSSLALQPRHRLHQQEQSMRTCSDTCQLLSKYMYNNIYSYR